MAPVQTLSFKCALITGGAGGIVSQTSAPAGLDTPFLSSERRL